jgi:hypothetical protein
MLKPRPPGRLPAFVIGPEICRELPAFSRPAVRSRPSENCEGEGWWGEGLVGKEGPVPLELDLLNMEAGDVTDEGTAVDPLLEGERCG